MKNLFLLILFFVVMSLPASEPSVEDFFIESGNIAAKYSEDKIYPLGRKMLFSMYSLNAEDIQKASDNYHTATGPSYGSIESQSSRLAVAGNQGIKYLYRIGINPRNSDEPIPSEKEIKAVISEQLESVKDNTDICVWVLASEEIRHWRDAEMNLLKASYEAIKANDPLGRPVYMYEPNHRKAGSLAHTVVYQDMCGKGSYVNYVSKKTDRVWVKWSIEQQIEAIERANPDAIPLMLAEMYRDPPENEWHLIEKWTRHDLYLSLISGAKGVLIWSGYRGRPNFQNTFENYFDGYSSVAKDLNGDLKLAEVFLFGERKDDIAISIDSEVKTLDMSYHGDERTYPSVNIANIAYDNQRYLFIVNSANEKVNITVSGLPKEDILINDVFDGGNQSTLTVGKFHLELDALDVKCKKITKR